MIPGECFSLRLYGTIFVGNIAHTQFLQFCHWRNDHLERRSCWHPVIFLWIRLKFCTLCFRVLRLKIREEDRHLNTWVAESYNALLLSGRTSETHVSNCSLFPSELVRLNLDRRFLLAQMWEETVFPVLKQENIAPFLLASVEHDSPAVSVNSTEWWSGYCKVGTCYGKSSTASDENDFRQTI